MSRKCVLIVDDKEENLYFLGALLTGHGYEVEEARHGAEALARARQSPPHLVISDLLMPVMDGYTLLRHWKSDERLRHIPFIVYTATYTEPKDEKLALDLGADAFIIKPTEPEPFMSRVQGVLAKQESGLLSPVNLPTGDEEVRIKQYNAALIRKLEEKALQLEEAKRALELDIAERRKAEEALRESEVHYSALFDNILDAVLLTKPDGGILSANPAACRMFGRTEEEICTLGRRALVDSSDPRLAQLLEIRARTGKASGEMTFIRSDGTSFPGEVSSIVFRVKSGAKLTSMIIRDITERKRMEAERDKLQAQLIQAQKLESVGRLAGGVAHDFNNMLGVILGHAELAMERTPPDNPLYEDLKEIFNAARRSTDITRQLLAFARRQTISPAVLDLNETVESMLKMLRRLIGEDIDLTWRPGAGLWPVLMDPSQINQVLANLCVNARDAIGGVGKITLETDNVRFEASGFARHSEFVPGDYVLLVVSDNGCGMDKETQAHLFEPFFTTKGVGEGTGLGLATVYGIVQQNGGFINVYSEPGKGAVFRIYLPRNAGDAGRTEAGGAAAIPQSRGETVLLVEDEVSILNLAKAILERLGYTVLDAATPGRALGLAEAHGGDLHLLITDVVMPEMNGRDLAQRLQSLYAGLKVLYMSGYTANVIAHRGILDEGIHFIQKPFNMKDLATKVRGALDAG